VEPDVLGHNVDLLEMSVLFAADNVDHNIITIDGKGTFRGMGVIASVTPKPSHYAKTDLGTEN